MTTKPCDIEDAKPPAGSRGERLYRFQVSGNGTLIRPAGVFEADYLGRLKLEGRYLFSALIAADFKTGMDDDINSLRRHTALVAPMVAILERKRPGLVLHSIDPRARAGRFDPVPGPSLAGGSSWPWSAFTRRNRNHGVLSSVPGPSLFAIESRDREPPDILYDIQRVRRADELGCKSPPAPRQSRHR